MSGSNDRPTDPRGHWAQGMEIDPGPSSAQQGFRVHPAAPRSPSQLPVPDEFYAPAREPVAGKERSNESIVPAGSVTGRSLTMVITIMCFLACLTAGAVYLMNQSATAWLSDIASEVTVQVEPRGSANTEKLLKDVTKLLRRTNGINIVRTLSVADSTALLEPWLGQSEILKTLPIPRLIALELNRRAPPDFTRLRRVLAASFEGVTLDDHRQWQEQIRTVTRSFALGGMAILLLVGAATTAIIVSATRSAMASNREIVEVLHFVGATDKFIAHEFSQHFLKLGIRAGVIGAGFAMLVFFTMPSLMQLLGGGTLTATQIQRLIGTGALDLTGYGALALVVVVIAALCMATSRFGVSRMLNASQ